MPEIGEKVRFRPSAFVGEGEDPAPMGWHQIPRMVTGTIVYINRLHRHYMAEYQVHGVTLRESFKF